MKIRTATVNDAAQIAKVHVDSWRTTYRGIVPDSFLDGMSYEERTKRWQKISVEQNVFVAETDDDTIVGFANGGRERQGKFDGYNGELYAIYILQEYQGDGIGRQLTAAVVDSLLKEGLHSMLIWVLQDNPATYFYESIGGKRIGTDELEINGVKLTEIAYGWKKLTQFRK
ncbi:GNAT family N-acetyltransferase [Virgibacillus siamensis]|uniref:GNAT family N-acetyltransferase n=1 Tax=Virgibacillus siamensis TaxID=480071 RepID=A0ABN1FNS5_9BACI